MTNESRFHEVLLLLTAVSTRDCLFCRAPSVQTPLRPKYKTLHALPVPLRRKHTYPWKDLHLSNSDAMKEDWERQLLREAHC